MRFLIVSSMKLPLDAPSLGRLVEASLKDRETLLLLNFFCLGLVLSKSTIYNFEMKPFFSQENLTLLLRVLVTPSMELNWPRFSTKMRP